MDCVLVSGEGSMSVCGMFVCVHFCVCSICSPPILCVCSCSFYLQFRGEGTRVALVFPRVGWGLKNRQEDR